MKIIRAFIVSILIPILVSCSLSPSSEQGKAIELETIKKEADVSQELEPMSDMYKKDIGLNKPSSSPKQFIAPKEEEFDFTLPKGYVDDEGNIHREGKMRLVTSEDRILAMRNPMVRKNPSYLIVAILSRVVTSLGTLQDINPGVIEGLLSSDFSYIQKFYNDINYNYATEADISADNSGSSNQGATGYSTYDFSLPRGVINEDGILVREGTMRTATAADEILPLNNPRVQTNPEYLQTIILSRVVIRLGDRNDVNEGLIESLCDSDYQYLLELYNTIN